MSESPRGEAERLAEEMISWGATASAVDTRASRDPQEPPAVKKVGNAVVTNITREAPKTRLTMPPRTPRK
ncbi:MAG TPA: hypothetical protein VLF20_01255 [Patescibacteria group bacterium]|nr:hypothetical protein [Patescibacteria group bacterium]